MYHGFFLVSCLSFQLNVRCDLHLFCLMMHLKTLVRKFNLKYLLNELIRFLLLSLKYKNYELCVSQSAQQSGNEYNIINNKYIKI